MKNLLKFIVFSLLLCSALLSFGENDAFANGSAITTGPQTAMKTISVGAYTYALSYVGVGTTATVSIQMEGSTNNGSSYSLCGVASTTLPVPAAPIQCVGVYDHVRVNVTVLTGAAPNILWAITGNALSPTPATTPAGTTGQAPAIVYPGLFVSYSPTQLNLNAVTLPASTNTTESIIVDVRGAKQIVLSSTCTQVYNILITSYAEDGSTNIGTIQLVGAETTPACQTGVTSDSPNWGTCIGPSNSPKLPQRAISFHFQNTTVTPGTCTARLFVAY